MKKILLITTGGTIASVNEGNGLKPGIDADGLVSKLSGWAKEQKDKQYTLKTFELMDIDSSNMNLDKMGEMAQTISDFYKLYDGFVITHGTDTMAYSACALSCMLQNIEKPVILTGSQLPMENKLTDAIGNLSDAIHFACEDIGGVCIAFDGKLIDGFHATKLKSKSMDAFYSIGKNILAKIQEDTIVWNSKAVDNTDFKGKEQRFDKPVDILPKTKMDQKVLVIRITPGMDTAIFDFVKEHYHGVVIEGFGVGDIPCNQPDLVSKIHELLLYGVKVVITTQCMYDGIDLQVYEVGRTLADENIISGRNNTTECLVMKLMWALYNLETDEDIKRFIER